MTTLQSIQNSMSNAVVYSKATLQKTKANLQNKAQHAKAWMDKNVAPHYAKIAVTTAAFAAATLSAIALRNFLNSNTPHNTQANPTNSIQNQTIDCDYYLNNQYVLALTNACANYTKPIIDIATKLVNGTTQKICNLFESSSITLADKPVIVLTSSSLNSSTAVTSNINNYPDVCELLEAKDICGFFDSIDHLPADDLTSSKVNGSTAHVVATNLSSNDTEKVIKNASNISIATNSSSNSSKLQENLVYNNDKTSGSIAQLWNSSKVFVSETAYPAIINLAAKARESGVSTQEYLNKLAEAHNITAELAYRKFEAVIGVSTASTASYYITKSTTEALRVFLLTSSKINEEGKAYFEFAKTLLDIFNNNYQITSKEQLSSLIEILKSETNLNLRQLNLLDLFNNYKAAQGSKKFDLRPIAQQNFLKIAEILKKSMAEGLKTTGISGELNSIDSSKKDSSGIQMMLQSFQNLITKYCSEKKAPGTSYTATVVAGVVALVATVASARFTSLV